MTVVDVRTFTNAFVSMNADGDGKPFFSDVKVRLALVQAIDREAVVNDVLGGRGEADPTPIPSRRLGVLRRRPPRKYPYDQLAAVEGARRRGLDAGAGRQGPDQQGGVPFKVGLVVAGLVSEPPDRGRGGAASLACSGIEVDVKAGLAARTSSRTTCSAAPVPDGAGRRSTSGLTRTCTRCGTRAPTRPA